MTNKILKNIIKELSERDVIADLSNRINRHCELLNRRNSVDPQNTNEFDEFLTGEGVAGINGVFRSLRQPGTEKPFKKNDYCANVRTNWAQIKQSIENINIDDTPERLVSQYQDICKMFPTPAANSITNRLIATFWGDKLTYIADYAKLKSVFTYINAQESLKNNVANSYFWLPLNRSLWHLISDSLDELDIKIETNREFIVSMLGWPIQDYINEKEKSKRKRESFMENYKTLVEKARNIILTGAPGTGKTYLAKEIAKSLAGNNYEMVQFHPSYDYSDFVEGLRPVKNANGNIGFERKDGVFKAFCKKALNDGYDNTGEGWKYKGEDAPKYVFIIDEINRGEMSKIFGELFFSIDPGYRGIKGRINTQYQNLVDKEYDEKGNIIGDDVFKDGFFVPENVYIIGTMNDIDRSVESMDFAMRRRFVFKEVKAEDRIDMWSDKNQLSSEKIKLANSLMRSLNCAIEKIPGLTSAYHIGPSYFLKLKECSEDELWSNSLYGLLYEYLRGMPNADALLVKLHEVYSNAASNQFDGDLQAGRENEIKNKMNS